MIKDGAAAKREYRQLGQPPGSIAAVVGMATNHVVKYEREPNAS